MHSQPRKHNPPRLATLSTSPVVNPPQPAPRHRRQSTNTTMNPPGRRPIRSSPLAGPALSGDWLSSALEKEECRPSKVSSTPDLTALVSSSTAARRPRTSQGLPSLSRPSSSAAARTSLSASPSARSFRALEMSKRADHSSVDLPPAPPASIPAWVRPKSPPANPSALASRKSRSPLPETEIDAHHRTHASHDASESWLTTNTYSTTPRFSRLGLASSNVVMPISAREHSRLSRPSSMASIASHVSATRKPGSMSGGHSRSSSSHGNLSEMAGGGGPDPEVQGGGALTRTSSAVSSLGDSTGGETVNCIVFTPRVMAVTLPPETSPPDGAIPEETDQLERAPLSPSYPPTPAPPPPSLLLPPLGDLRQYSSCTTLGRQRSWTGFGLKVIKGRGPAPPPKYKKKERAPYTPSYVLSETSKESLPIVAPGPGLDDVQESCGEKYSVGKDSEEVREVVYEKPKKAGKLKRLWRALSGGCRP